ncbi:hypothetical protein Agub_g5656 [Astrephomene gubernaculifera]|uniref:Uncharacterized protein n=1 Tax=Astrephomene gubernaculifera TaxID=47775 RepID=A0AAD3DM75_9CHLO|nr:hypothetical protein Agub_g5656 [Astrephomene gubernaculifera]
MSASSPILTNTTAGKPGRTSALGPNCMPGAIGSGRGGCGNSFFRTTTALSSLRAAYSAASTSAQPPPVRQLRMLVPLPSASSGSHPTSVAATAVIPRGTLGRGALHRSRALPGSSPLCKRGRNVAVRFFRDGAAAAEGPGDRRTSPTSPSGADAAAAAGASRRGVNDPASPPEQRQASDGGSEGKEEVATAQPPTDNAAALPFVASTRLRHHYLHEQPYHGVPPSGADSGDNVANRADAAAAAGSLDASAATGRSPEAFTTGGGGPLQEASRARTRRRSHRTHQQHREDRLFEEAEERAVALHPDILLEDLVAEASVPFDAAGGYEGGGAGADLDLDLASSDAAAAAGGGGGGGDVDDAGEAAVRPSGGAGPHAGLAIEDVDPRSGGFMASRPLVDSAYDDVGRAIRAEQGRHVHHSSASAESVEAAEAAARKAATADDQRERLLDAAPELQETYGVYGGFGSEEGGALVGGEGRLEELLETAPFGEDEGVMVDLGGGGGGGEAAAAAEAAAEATSPLADPLRQLAGGGGSGARDPLTALDALAHQEALELLQEGAADEDSGSSSSSSSNNSMAAGEADVADVMPAPPILRAMRGAPPTAAAAVSNGGGAGRAGSSTDSTSNDKATAGQQQQQVQQVQHNQPRVGRRLQLNVDSGSGPRLHLRRQQQHHQHHQQAHAPNRPGGSEPAEKDAAPMPPPVAQTLPPPFFRTSPDVPDEDLEHPPPAAAAHVPPAVPRGGGGGGGGGEQTKGVAATPAVAPGGAHASTAAPGRLNNNPDVADEDVERRDGNAAPLAAEADTSDSIAPGDVDVDSGGGGGGGGGGLVHGASPLPPPGVQGHVGHQPAPQAGALRGGWVGGDSSSIGKGAEALRKLRSFGDIDRQFIGLESSGGSWDERGEEGALRRAAEQQRAEALAGPSSADLQDTGGPSAATSSRSSGRSSGSGGDAGAADRAAPASPPREPNANNKGSSSGSSGNASVRTLSPGARGASSSLQTQTIGIHGHHDNAAAGASGEAEAVSPSSAPASVTPAAAGFGGGGGGFTVLRVESVPSQTYGGVRTAAVLAANGKLTLLARPTGPSRERVRAAIKLLHMAPDSREFRSTYAAAAEEACYNDERVAAADAAAAAAVVAAAAMAGSIGTAGMELEVMHRSTPVSSVDVDQVVQEQPGLVLGQSEVDPATFPAEPLFPVESDWHERHLPHDPHDPHGTSSMMDAEARMLAQEHAVHEDYDEVMGQIEDAQRSGWAEDAVVRASYDSDVY